MLNKAFSLPYGETAPYTSAVRRIFYSIGSVNTVYLALGSENAVLLSIAVGFAVSRFMRTKNKNKGRRHSILFGTSHTFYFYAMSWWRFECVFRHRNLAVASR